MRLDQLLDLSLKESDPVWDADRSIEAMNNLGKLDRMGFLTKEEVDLLAKTVRAFYRRDAKLPPFPGDPKV